MSDFKLELNPANLNDLGIEAKDEEEAVKLARTIKRVFENPDFKAIVKIDNVRFANSVRACTNKTAPAIASTFLQVYDEYQELPVDAARLVYESGVSDLDVQAAIKVRVNGTNNGVLLRRIMTPPLALRRDQLEDNYADFMLRVVGWEQAKRAAQQKKQE